MTELWLFGLVQLVGTDAHAWYAELDLSMTRIQVASDPSLTQIQVSRCVSVCCC